MLQRVCLFERRRRTHDFVAHPLLLLKPRAATRDAKNARAPQPLQVPLLLLLSLQFSIRGIELRGLLATLPFRAHALGRTDARGALGTEPRRQLADPGFAGFR